MLFDSQSSRNFTAIRVLIKINCNFLRDDEVAGFLVCKRKKDFLHCELKEKKKEKKNKSAKACFHKKYRQDYSFNYKCLLLKKVSPFEDRERNQFM